MTDRSISVNTAYREPLTRATAQASMLGELYWYVHVVDAGGFSAAAERTGVAKSSLSRRIMQLEGRLNVKLLNRNTRSFAMTAIGEQIYRNALDMLNSAEAAELYAQRPTMRLAGWSG